MLDFRLYTFLNLCKTMNYTRTAKELCITQPAVTQHIHFLEEHYGCKLFSYEKKVLRLTPQGEILKMQVHALDYRSRKLEELLREPEKIRLRVGATKTIGDYLAAPMISSFLKKNPGSQVSLLVNNTADLLRGLDEGELDFAMIEGFFDKGEYGCRLMRREPFVGICSPENPLADSPVPVRRLLGEHLIVREQGSGTRAVLEHFLEEHNCTVDGFRAVTEVSDFRPIKELVRENLGVSFLYRTVLEEELARGELAILQLTDERGKKIRLSHEFNLVYRTENGFRERWADFLSLSAEMPADLETPPV